MMLTTALLCIITPILAKTPPTPMRFNGTDLLGHGIFTDILVVAASLTRTSFAISAFIAYDGLFMVNVAILCSRYRCVGEILGLLNYDGERDEGKDKRIIRDFYYMHLHLYE